MYSIHPCSAAAQRDLIGNPANDRFGVKRLEDMHSTTKYPFDLLRIGEAFHVPLEDVRMQTLRAYCSQAHPLKRFKLYVRQHKGIFEVVRLS